MTNIIIFGDSITWGAWDEKGGWTQRLRSFIEKSYPPGEEVFFTYNLGIPGNKTSNILERLRLETEERIDKNYEPEEIVFIFEVGGNDSAWLKEENRHKIEKEQFEKNIQELIKIAKEYSNKIVFVGAIQHDESKSCPISWNKNMHYYNKHQKEYNEIVKKTCKNNKVHFIDILKIFDVSNLKDLLHEDGVHPNSRGHKLIFNKVKKYIIKNKILT